MELFHYGSGRFKIVVGTATARYADNWMLVEVDTDEDGVGVVGEYEFETTCSDCWETFELMAYFPDESGTYIGGGHGHPWRTFLYFCPILEEASGRSDLSLGVCAEGVVDGVPHPHPWANGYGIEEGCVLWAGLHYAGIGDHMISVEWSGGGKCTSGVVLHGQGEVLTCIGVIR
jgi:hypothetical protein